ncbi:MAG: hypothetical protein ACRCYY_21545, partial [Trueperaceae bacterium]
TLTSNTLPTIIFTHQPLSDVATKGNRLFDPIPHYLTPANADKARVSIEASGNVKLIINGHTHWNHLERVNGIPYVTLTAVTPLVFSEKQTEGYSVLTANETTIHINVHGRESMEITLNR